MKLAGAVVVVTGASRGIGRAMAATFAGEGAKVVGCALHTPAGGLPFEGFFQVCDVRRADDVARFRDVVVATWGPPDVLVNNVGTVVRAPFASLAESDWDDVIAANLKSAFLVTLAFLPGMQKRKRGRIINMSSIAGRQGTAGLTAYCAAKHGVVGLTRALAEELRGDGIAVNAICPGSTDTDMLKIGMPGGTPNMTAGEVARVALFLAAAAPVALTGSCIDVFG